MDVAERHSCGSPTQTMGLPRVCSRQLAHRPACGVGLAKPGSGRLMPTPISDDPSVSARAR